MARVLGLTDTFPFGKHKGQQVEDLLYDDPQYLTWCVDEEVVEFDEEVLHQMEERKLI